MPTKLDENLLGEIKNKSKRNVTREKEMYNKEKKWINKASERKKCFTAQPDSLTP